MILKGLENIKKLYFIGIGGVSMSALAKFCAWNGYQVCGSDVSQREITKGLAFYGVKVFIGSQGDRKELQEACAVVYTDAIAMDDLELLSAKKQAKKIFSRMEFLALIASNFQFIAAISGSHGKTTCTSMCAHVFKAASAPFCAHIGGSDATFDNFHFSGFEYFLTEACEYKKNFLKLQAHRAVVLNIDCDHMECYENEEDLIDSFSIFSKNAETTFVCADDKNCQKLGDFPSFGIENVIADYRAVDLKASGERYAFTVEEYGKALCRIKLSAIGKCNVYNALAAFALSRSFGFSEREIKRGLENFQSVKRRFEWKGTYHGASVICDYAHHPREIESTIATALGVCKGELYVVFQPHTYSRTKILMEEFIRVLRPVKNLMLYKTYPAREKFEWEGSGECLAKKVGSCLYSENVNTLKIWMQKTLKEGDVLLFLGAGDIYYIAEFLLREFKEK